MGQQCATFYPLVNIMLVDGIARNTNYAIGSSGIELIA